MGSFIFSRETYHTSISEQVLHQISCYSRRVSSLSTYKVMFSSQKQTISFRKHKLHPTRDHSHEEFLPPQGNKNHATLVSNRKAVIQEDTVHFPRARMKQQCHKFIRFQKKLIVIFPCLGLYLWIIMLSTSNYRDILLSLHRPLSIYRLCQEKPRIILVEDQNDLAQAHNLSEYTYSKARKRRISRKWETNAQIDHGLEDFEEGECKAMHDWQLKTFPSCNNVHENDFLQYTYITSGGWRDVWKGYEYNGQPYAIKTLVFEGTDFRFRDSERHRRDANTYSMLQGSSHIMNIYGYCVNTAMFDFVEGGTLYDMLKNGETLKWSSEKKLRYSWQLAKALADLHNVGNIYGSAAIAHTDISPDQYLWFDNMFKLNDFNRARFIRWNAVKHEACPFHVGLAPGRNRSPEEYGDSPLTEKIDVYSLGNAFLYILTGTTSILPHLKERDAIHEIVHGSVKLDAEFIEKLDEKELAISHAIKMCHVKEPSVRSSSADVEKYLRRKIEDFQIERYS